MTTRRYLALVGIVPNNERFAAITARAAGLGLRRHDCAEDLVVFSAPKVPVDHSASCTVVGEIHPAVPPNDIDDPGDLVQHRWGNYLAFGHRAGQRADWILRSPLGHLPVFRMTVGTTMLLASDAALLLFVTGIEPQIDWTFAAQHLACPHLQTANTGLVGIDELLGGESLRRDRTSGWARTIEWSPWAFTGPELEIRATTEAEQALRGAVERTVGALTRSQSQVLLELSGGLDSSILAAALARTKASARAVTLVTEEAEGDERIYAHATAMATGLPLKEVPVSTAIDLAQPAAICAARPGLPMLLSLADDALADRARLDGITGFISGVGGDCVFCSPVSAAPAADVIRRFGTGRHAWRVVNELARLHNANVWRVARMAWRQARSGPLHARWPIQAGLLCEDRVPSAVPYHPWLEEPAGILPGKRSQVRAIMAALAHVDGYGRHAVAPSCYPTLSQPVVEVALRIPTWLCVAGGRDRAVARDAWRDTLPAQVLERRVKGGLDAYAIDVLAENRTRLMPFLLEGHLAQSGLIDRPRVEQALQGPARRGATVTHLLLPLADTEAWARAWLGDP
jgi:asparagine synthase (glutamine-hydrolysing)